MKLGVQYCPSCRARIEPQSAEAITARLLKDYRGKKITLLAPLIVARKGLYTALAKWARSKGFRELRVDGKVLPTAKWPRLDRFVEHSIELPVATLEVSTAREEELREALAERPRARPRRVARAGRCQRLGRRRARRCSRPSARVRIAAPAFRSSIRDCSPSTRGTAGARAASVPGSRCPSSMPSKAARRRSGASPPKARRMAAPRPARSAPASA